MKWNPQSDFPNSPIFPRFLFSQTNNTKQNPTHIFNGKTWNQNRRKIYLSRDSGTNGKEKAAKFARNGGRQNSEGIISPAFGKLAQESKEEHIEDVESTFDNLTSGFMTQIQTLVHKDLNQRPWPNPHEGDYEIAYHQTNPSHFSCRYWFGHGFWKCAGGCEWDLTEKSEESKQKGM